MVNRLGLSVCCLSSCALVSSGCSGFCPQSKDDQINCMSDGLSLYVRLKNSPGRVPASVHDCWDWLQPLHILENDQ